MARIAGVSGRQAGPSAKLAFFFTRRQLAWLTGRKTKGMIEPIQLYAHVPALLRAYGKFEQATATLRRVDQRLRALAELKAATLTNCEYCIDLGSQIARRWGLHDEEMLALPSYQTSALFSDLDKLVLDYAVAMSRTPVEVSDDLFAQLRKHFDDAQLVELTHLIALENMRGRFNLALGVTAAGFSTGLVCAMPTATTVRRNPDVATTSESVTLINEFTVPTYESARFLERWKGTARMMAGQPGFVRARMYRSLTEDTELRFINVAEWQSRAALEKATATPDFHASTQRMLKDPELHVTLRPAVYQVAVELRPSDAG